MEIETLRDWVIVIWGVLGIGATLLLIALLILIYRKVTPILESAKQTADTVRDTSSTVSKYVIQPIAKVQGVMAGARKTATFVSSIKKRKGGENGK